MPASSKPTESLESEKKRLYLQAMRQVACSVSVVTTNGPAGRFGATVSAFSSVSADPPSLLICLNESGSICKAVAENAVFRLNILPPSAVDISNRFAGMDDASVDDRFEGIAHHGEVPSFDGASSFLCRLTQSAKVGSHMVYIGEVESIEMVPQQPLTYLDGQYGVVTALPTSEDKS